MAVSRIVGLDIGTTTVRAAQFEGIGGRGAPTVTRIAQVALPVGAVRDGEVTDQPAVSAALREAWRQGGFTTKDVILGLGNPRVVVRDLELPWLPIDQLKASLPYQVQEMLPMQASDALLDFLPTAEYEGDTGRMAVGVLVAAPRDVVSSMMLAVDGAGLNALMVDLNAFGQLRSVVHGSMRDRTLALVDIGATVTDVVITAGGVPRLTRVLRGGGGDVTDSVASALSIALPDAENLKREIGFGFQVPPEYQAAADGITAVTRNLLESIRNTFTFFAGNNPGVQIEAIVLTGGGSNLPGLGQYLSSFTRISVVLGDPLAGVKLGKGINRNSLAGNESLLATAIGLGMGDPS